MRKIEIFNLILDKSDGIYTVGETCTGQIVLKLNGRLKIKSIVVSLQSLVNMSENNQNGNSKSFSIKSNIIDSKVVLFDNNSCQNLQLETDEYYYPFSLLIPDYCLNTFEQVDFKMKYSIKATLNLPWTSNEHVTQGIFVINPVNLNSKLSLAQPASSSDKKQFGFCCFKSESCSAQIRISKTGFIGGESINFTAKVDNQSVKMLQMRVMLLQHVKIVKKAETKKITRTISSEKFISSINPNADEEWNSSIKIPPLCPSTNDSFGILNVSYTLTLELDPSRFSKCLQVSVPIFIGTIPFKEDQNNSK